MRAGSKGKGKCRKGGAARSLVLGEIGNGVRGRSHRHEGAGASGLQKTASARDGRYDKQALRDVGLQGVRGTVPRRADGVVLGLPARRGEGDGPPTQEAAMGVLIA